MRHMTLSICEIFILKCKKYICVFYNYICKHKQCLPPQVLLLSHILTYILVYQIIILVY